MPNTAMFIGAHPDDVEIGAGGTVKKLTQKGWDVWLVIMTDDRDPVRAEERRLEAVAAGAELGVGQPRIVFLHNPDGNLANNKPQTVEQLRNVAREARPDLIFTHCQSDDHQDHKATHEATCAALRERPRLYYAVVNHLVESKFAPTVFVDTDSEWAYKRAALQRHGTQSGRINESRIVRLDEGYESRCGLARAEAFELDVPTGAADRLALVASLNDSVFHRFWETLLTGRPLHLIYAIPVSRVTREFHWPAASDRDGMALFKRSFDSHWSAVVGRPMLEEIRSDQPAAISALRSSHVLLSGGPVSNSATREHFNHFVGLRYHIDYDMPEFHNIRIVDVHRQALLTPIYSRDAHGAVSVEVDIGILTIMRNPYTIDGILIAVMGIHGFGTMACYKIISEPIYIRELLEMIKLPLPSLGYQILVEYDVKVGRPTLVPNSLHMIE